LLFKSTSLVKDIRKKFRLRWTYQVMYDIIYLWPQCIDHLSITWAKIKVPKSFTDFIFSLSSLSSDYDHHIFFFWCSPRTFYRMFFLDIWHCTVLVLCKAKYVDLRTFILNTEYSTLNTEKKNDTDTAEAESKCPKIVLSRSVIFPCPISSVTDVIRPWPTNAISTQSYRSYLAYTSVNVSKSANLFHT
jgi:hypothetical protein